MRFKRLTVSPSLMVMSRPMIATPTFWASKLSTKPRMLAVEFDELAGHDVLEPVHTLDTVTDGEHGAGFLELRPCDRSR